MKNDEENAKYDTHLNTVRARELTMEIEEIKSDSAVQRIVVT